jgi:hypothetical protein
MQRWPLLTRDLVRLAQRKAYRASVRSFVLYRSASLSIPRIVDGIRPYLTLGVKRDLATTINGLAQPFDLVSSPHIRVGRTPEFHKPGSDKEFGALQPSPDCTNPYPTSILRETRAIFPAFSDTPYTSAVSVACPASGSAHHYPSAPEIVKDRITGSLCVKETSVQPPPNAFPAPQLTLCRRKAQSFFRRKKACYQRIGSEHSLYR